MAPENITQACNRAGKLRKKWGAGIQPAYNLSDLCENNNVLILRTQWDSGLSGAFIRKKKEKFNVILVNTKNKNKHHQRFTLAHELGHLELHKNIQARIEDVSYAEDNDKTLEKEANAFAAAFLVPLEEIELKLKDLNLSADNVTNRDIVELASFFGVSHHVIIRRLNILAGLSFDDYLQRIDQGDWNHLWKQFAPDGHKDTIPREESLTWHPNGVSKQTAKQVSRLPLRYIRLALEAYRRGKITSKKLADLLELPDRDAVVKEIQPIYRPDLVKEKENLEKSLKNNIGN